MHKLLAATALVLVCATPLWSQAGTEKPNFSGKWAADMAKSDFEGMPDLGTMALVIEHHEPAFNYTWTHTNAKGKVQAGKYVHTTDGQVHRNFFGKDVETSTTKWNGRALVTEASMSVGSVRERWDLSPDGKTLTFVREFLKGERPPQKVIWLKQ